MFNKIQDAASSTPPHALLQSRETLCFGYPENDKDIVLVRHYVGIIMRAEFLSSSRMYIRDVRALRIMNAGKWNERCK
ncbi:hypothetical protein KIN20_031187 [Parelaphostrongylus tenuis]|uniref:Uncharacterized protein n=1 Tax=Parelaphostrongylus tenuis TaxID=148309 RepID=A0AAD5R4T2_PARTN|nr:hypothetical protein KIN20_031187 [Parelaphostrongylus tenuis]